MLKLKAPAKINLFLRILARERSGFHQLETLFTSLEFGDFLTLERRSSGITLETVGPSMGPPDENLCVRAAQQFFGEAGVTGGVWMHLEKTIPVAAGLGGGSSDAAATLLGLQRLFPGALEEEKILELAGALGSDVPFFLSSSPLTLAWGRGHRLLPLPPLPPAPVVLALPPVEVSTARAYAALAQAREEAPRPPVARIHPMESFSSWEAVAAHSSNDFEEVVFQEYPLLEEIREALAERLPIFSRLSGSGAAIFALFSDENSARSARDALSTAYSDISFLLTHTQSRRSGWPGCLGG
jgi:4-diphosphocytidyl-2-C-methyl-D-erythritol kinase